jgi:hypothetical protein
MADAERMQNMKLKTNVKAGGIWENHNETLASQPKKGLRVSTNLRAGGVRMMNHNETLASQPKKGRKTRLSR